MGRVRLTRAARARAGVLTGGAMAASGAGLGLGLAVGLVVGGVLLVTYCLLLADTGGGGP
ncbi:hypothetical protein PV439_14170 [Streptomyces scabiei]|uniref:hypothetical protein n=1 Tax=Streptomyces scabiei TaxID=1930 RepID=UPI0005A030C2|nr:hypothetical protein [Streptomyces scabiei]MDX2892494.1 hypothetical protein [Streptomyces scabiei]MDX2900587.1 hypothetical protein [Streptomyces scabiei]MDX2994119.1 hypothetical protein [Streptomyces scabiei]MDX3084761.1 hypothetical protein [Streptomyces scabiei]MDX3137889.1 hypothetical protein [Streptomyces scabiei]